MFTRDEVLDELRDSSNIWNEYWYAWEKVRDWIADMVQIEPKVMKRVSERRFGDLGNWIQRGSGNVGACGCLVGSCALELVNDRNHFKVHARQGNFTLTKPIGTYKPEDEYDYNASEVVELLAADKQFIETMRVESNDAGRAASTLQVALGQDKAVWLIKNEIVKQLKLRNARVRAGRKSAASTPRTKTGQFLRVA